MGWLLWDRKQEKYALEQPGSVSPHSVDEGHAESGLDGRHYFQGSDMMDGDGRRQTQGGDEHGDEHGDEQRESITEDEGVIAVPIGSTAGMQNESDSDTVDIIPNANGQT